jgi:hypothetical protein
MGVLLKSWTKRGLIKTKYLATDIAAISKYFAYSIDAHLLHKVVKKLVGAQIDQQRGQPQEVF